MKKVLKTALLLFPVLLASCQENTILNVIDTEGFASKRASNYIEFRNYVSGMTRASVRGNNFASGDAMGVWGYQITNGVSEKIFNNQEVVNVDTAWTYSNKKLWNVGSDYMFYGMFPYSTSLYNMSNDNYISIANYTVVNNPEDQVDLMISERRNVEPFNTVDMIFHHILSNVNMYVRVAKQSEGFDLDNIESITLNSLKLNNVKNTGSYAQTGWASDNSAVGTWTISGASPVMTIANNTSTVITETESLLLKDYLMMPQVLFETTKNPNDVTVDVTFRVAYTDGTASTINKNGVRLTGLTGTSISGTSIISSWEPNYRYNYTMIFNPTLTTRIWDATITDPDSDTIRFDPSNLDVVEIYEDTDGDGKPDTWVEYPVIWDDTDGDGQDEPYIDKDGDGTPDDPSNPLDTENEIIRYNPDKPNVVEIFEDTDGDGKPDTWVEYPVVWVDVDGDGDLEPCIDKDNDGNPDDNNNDGKPDQIYVHTDTDKDKDVDDDDDWTELSKDPDTGIIEPEREFNDATIEFSATVSEWDNVNITHTL